MISHLKYDRINETAVQFVSGKLLDLGCGSQPFRKLMKANTTTYIGLDLGSPDMEQRAEVIGSASDVPFKTGSFDTVLCTEVIEHVSEPWLVMDQISRVLRPGGVLILTSPLIARIHGAPRDFYRFTPYGLEHMASKVGIETVSISPMGGFGQMMAYMFSFFWERVIDRRFRPRGYLGQVLRSALSWLGPLAYWIGKVIDRVEFDDRNSWNHVYVGKRVQ